MLKSCVFLGMLYCAGLEAATAREIVLGQIASVTNPVLAETGKELQRGYQIYFDKINAAGGLDGRKILLLQKEDGYDARNALRLTKELIDKDGALALVGYMGTPGPLLIATEGVLADNGIAMIAPASGTAKVQSQSNVFPVRATYEAELAEIARHSQSMLHKKVAMLTWTAGAGPTLAKAWPVMIQQAKLDLVQNRTFDVASDPSALQHNIEAAIEPIASAKPDAVFLIASGNALYAAIKHLRATLPASMPIYTVSTVNWKDLIKQVGLKSAKGVIISQCVPYPYSSVMPIVKEYLADIKAAGKGDLPSYYGLEGYIGAAVTVEALRRAGPNPTRQGILDALTRMGKTQIGGFEVNYSSAYRQGFAKPDTTLITSYGTLLR